MGRGDKRSKKGKIFKGSFGNSRPHKQVKKSAPAPSAAVSPVSSGEVAAKKPAKKKKKE